jgi:hypothetical protein
MASSGAKFTIDGAPSTPRGFDAEASDVLVLTLEQNPSVDVTSCVYFVVAMSPGAPSPTFSNQGVANPVNASIFLTLPDPPSASAYTWSWMIRCQTNQGKGIPQSDGSLDYTVNTFDRIVTVKTATYGLRALISGESVEYSSAAWVKSVNDLMVALESNIIASTGDVNPSDNTLVLRDGTGQARATSFATASSSVATEGALRLQNGAQVIVATDSANILALTDSGATIVVGETSSTSLVDLQGATLGNVLSIDFSGGDASWSIAESYVSQLQFIYQENSILGLTGSVLSFSSYVSGGPLITQDALNSVFGTSVGPTLTIQAAPGQASSSGSSNPGGVLALKGGPFGTHRGGGGIPTALGMVTIQGGTAAGICSFSSNGMTAPCVSFGAASGPSTGATQIALDAQAGANATVDLIGLFNGPSGATYTEYASVLEYNNTLNILEFNAGSVTQVKVMGESPSVYMALGATNVVLNAGSSSGQIILAPFSTPSFAAANGFTSPGFSCGNAVRPTGVGSTATQIACDTFTLASGTIDLLGVFNGPGGSPSTEIASVLSYVAAAHESSGTIWVNGSQGASLKLWGLSTSVSILLGSSSISINSGSLTLASTYLALYGATPVAQPAQVTTLVDSTGGTPSGALAAVTAGVTYAQADIVALKNAVASLSAKVNALSTALSAGYGGIGATA